MPPAHAGIIDGTGSLGAAVGQYAVASISAHGSWAAVFAMLVSLDLAAACCIAPMFVRECADLWRQHASRRARQGMDSAAGVAAAAASTTEVAYEPLRSPAG